ncbi:MAG TPA: two pore domain potassium channel family protein [Chloroflexi bacterium]|nr:two pore domain potassium channel family protein [Chloroflexota bacterium]
MRKLLRQSLHQTVLPSPLHIFIIAAFQVFGSHMFDEMFRGYAVLTLVVLVVMIVIIIGSILIVLIEAPMPGANIKTGDDAVWWAIVTVSTVGYGDTYPMTPAGRLIGAAMIVMGVSLFSVLTSYIATQFMARRRISSVSEVELLRQEMRAAFVEFRRRAADENAALQAELTMLRRLLMEIADTTPPEA